MAAGLGIGILEPEFVHACLEEEANPDAEEWALARDHGLDIPNEPSAVSADDQTDSVRQSCLAFFEEYYPEAYETLHRLEAGGSSLEPTRPKTSRDTFVGRGVDPPPTALPYLLLERALMEAEPDIGYVKALKETWEEMGLPADEFLREALERRRSVHPEWAEVHLS